MNFCPPFITPCHPFRPIAFGWFIAA